MSEAVVQLQHHLNRDANAGTENGVENFASSGVEGVGGASADISDETDKEPASLAPVVMPEAVQSAPSSTKSKMTDARTRMTATVAKPGTRPLPKSSAPPPVKAIAGRPSVIPSSGLRPAGVISASKKPPTSSISTAPKAISAGVAASKASPTTGTTTMPAVSRRLSTAPASLTASKPAAPRASMVPSSTKSALRTSPAANAVPKPAMDAKSALVSPTPPVTPGKATPVSSDAGRKSIVTRSHTVTAPASRHVTRSSASTIHAGPPSAKDARTPSTHVSDLEAKVAESTKGLAESNERVQVLEKQLSELRVQLEHATSQAVEQTESLEKLSQTVRSHTESKQVLLADIASLTEAAGVSAVEIAKLKEEHQEADARAATRGLEMERSKAELEEARQALVVATEQIKALEDAKSLGDAAVADAAALDRKALLKANEDLHKIRDAVNSEHEANAELTQKLSVAESLQVESEKIVLNLRTELEQLLSEKKELENRISEAKVEVLEAKEEAEKTVDERQKEVAKLKSQHWEEKDQLTRSLQEDLRRAVGAQEDATKEWEETLEATRKKHAFDLDAALSDAEAKASAANEAVLKSLAEQHEARLNAQAKEHEDSFTTSKQTYEQSAASLQQVIDRLSKELEGEQAKFDSQVRELRNKQEELLKKAFNDAKSEAGAAHAQELAAFRAQSKAALEELQATNQNTLAELDASHEQELDKQKNALEKHVKELSINLAATSDDLAKNKTLLASSQEEIDSLRKQLDGARDAIAAASANADAVIKEQVQQAKKDVGSVLDDMNTYKKLLEETQLSFASDTEARMASHARELEELVSARTKETISLKESHEQELARYNAERAGLRSALEDERDAKEKALAQITSLQQIRSRSPPTSPRNTPARTGVSKEEIEKLHQAHNMTLMMVEAEHKKEMEALKKQIARLEELVNEAQGERDRKELELTFVTQEKSDLEDEVKQHVDELSELKARIGEISASA